MFWLFPRFHTTGDATSWCADFKRLPHAAINDHDRQQLRVSATSLPENRCIFLFFYFFVGCGGTWNNLLSLPTVPLLLCRAVFLAVNCQLMFSTAIILVALSDCTTIIYWSVCLLFPRLLLIMPPLDEAVFSQGWFKIIWESGRCKWPITWVAC